MAQRIAVITGKGDLIGIVKQTSHGIRGKMPKAPPAQQKARVTIFIKLPRNTVFACTRSCRRSLSFSHHEEIDGQRAIIYATGDNGGFHSAYEGDVTLVSSHGERMYALTEARTITRSEWNSREDLSKLTK